MKKIVQCFGLLILVFTISNVVFSQSQFKIPTGEPVMIDGKCVGEEWNDANEIDIGKDYKFKYKKTKSFVYFCVKPPTAQLFSAELYLSSAEEEAYTFHVSAKLGERELKGDKWEDFTLESNWWEIDGWTANPLRPQDFEKPKFLPSAAIEFQISRRRLKSNKWQIMLTLSGGSIVFPKDSNNLNTTTWAEFHL